MINWQNKPQRFFYCELLCLLWLKKINSDKGDFYLLHHQVTSTNIGIIKSPEDFKTSVII
jgi:hypothetical protein